MTDQFGDKLKRHRKGENVSLTHVCKSTHMDKAALRDVENNIVSPSKIMVEKLANCERLGLTYAILKDWRDLDAKIRLSPLWNSSPREWPYCSDFHL